MPGSSVASSVSDSLWPHELQHARLLCPSPSPRVCSNSCPLNWWCHPTILSSVTPFSCFQSFPASESFPMSLLLAWGRQSTGASASALVLPVNIQGWFPYLTTFLHITTLLLIPYFQLSKWYYDQLSPNPKSHSHSATAAKLLQSCPTLCDPIDGSPPGSAIPGILQARTLEWVAISFSNVWKWKVKVKSLSRVRLLATPWTAAYQAPPSMGFSRQEYWSGLPLPSLHSHSTIHLF